jgi:hypothetical protein
MNFDKYKNRLNRTGDNVGEAYKNNTIAFIEATFSSSPTYRVMEVLSTEFPNIKKMEARIVDVERLGNLREILFKPNDGLNVGSYVKFDDETWLITDKWGSRATLVSMLAQKCNRKLQWIDESGKLQAIDCIVSASLLGSKGNQIKWDISYDKFDVRLPIGQTYVFLERNEITKTIRMNQRFILSSFPFEVYGVDDNTYVDKNGFGITQLTLKITTKVNGDDFVNNIAVNKYDDNSNSTTGDGGAIW